MDAPRYFKYYTEENLKKILEKMPYDIIKISSTADGKWIHTIARKSD
jgi:c-di-AMP phosphodiesterase-like protein